jgi:hypothetical protein
MANAPQVAGIGPMPEAAQRPECLPVFRARKRGHPKSVILSEAQRSRRIPKKSIEPGKLEPF